MSDVQPAPPSARRPASDERTSWTRRTVAFLVVAIALVLLAVLFYTAVPRWWAERAGGQVDGSISTGVVLGFMYGFLCTLLPVFVLTVVYRFFRRRLLAWVVGISLALLLATPNLTTLWIAIGTGDAVDAADRTLDDEAPWFRGAMLAGAIAAVLFTVYVVVVRRSGRDPKPTARGEKPAAAPGPPSP